jgi:hypothetical protein
LKFARPPVYRDFPHRIASRFELSSKESRNAHAA